MSAICNCHNRYEEMLWCHILSAKDCNTSPRCSLYKVQIYDKYSKWKTRNHYIIQCDEWTTPDCECIKKFESTHITF